MARRASFLIKVSFDSFLAQCLHFSHCLKHFRTYWSILYVKPLIYFRFWLQSDNTVKECRNTYAARILSSLTMGGVWRTASQHFLEVGHTHEDVDGVLALCKSAIDGAQTLQTPRDVANCLREKLFTTFRARGVDLDVEVVGKATKLDKSFRLYLHDIGTFKGFRSRV